MVELRGSRVLPIGGGARVTAIFRSADGKVTDAQVKWVSTEPTIARVNALGDVTGLSEGAAKSSRNEATPSRRFSPSST
ncbi:MAG: hypothetical protein HC783_08395 [Rhodobacteraceae bacterium]|nr:hypothetical protein [Paracoccaceae bacterium]